MGYTLPPNRPPRDPREVNRWFEEIMAQRLWFPIYEMEGTAGLEVYLPKTAPPPPPTLEMSDSIR
jgi:hypothetical protein